MWTGYGKKIPVLIFKAESVVSKKPELRAVGGEICLDNIYYSFEKTLVQAFYLSEYWLFFMLNENLLLQYIHHV